MLWLFGTEGTGLIPLFHETLGFMILGVLAKVGFAFVLLISRAVVGGEDEE
jgi:bacteriorhodopsin